MSEHALARRAKLDREAEVHVACTWQRHVGRAAVSAHGPLVPLIPEGRGAPSAVKAIHPATCTRASTTILSLVQTSCIVFTPATCATDLVR